MRRLCVLLSIFSAVAFLGCAPDAGVGPRVASDSAPNVGATVNATIGSLDVLPPGPARAKAKVYCDCTSCYAGAFDFSEHRHPITGAPFTRFTAYFQNLQGTYPPNGPSTQLRLNYLRFVFWGSSAPEDDFVDAAVGISLSAVGNVLAAASGGWAHDSGLDPEKNHPVTIFWLASIPFGIIGCSEGANPPNFFSFKTCPAEGLDGWVKIEFALSRMTGWVEGQSTTAIRPPVRFDDFRFTFGSAFSSFCTIGGKQPGTCTELPYRSALGS